jgi:hypothetical protein
VTCGATANDRLTSTSLTGWLGALPITSWSVAGQMRGTALPFLRSPSSLSSRLTRWGSCLAFVQPVKLRANHCSTVGKSSRDTGMAKP